MNGLGLGQPLTDEEKMWEQFHMMWTRDATNHERPDYDKKAWVDLEAKILTALSTARLQAAAAGVARAATCPYPERGTQDGPYS